MNSSASPEHKFDFEYLWLFGQNQTVTYSTCVAVFGTGINWYDRRDVYDRVLLWRVPLLALLATTTIPAFGYHTQFFTIFHVITDPIDSIWSLLYKLDLARRTTCWAKRNDEARDDGTNWSFIFESEGTPDGNDPPLFQMTAEEITEGKERAIIINAALKKNKSPLPQYFRDVMASIITAYDEWGCGDQALKALNYAFRSTRWSAFKRTQLRKRCARAAFLIASDRVSRFLPATAAALVFFVQLSSSFWKTLNALGNTYDGSNPVSAGLNRTPYNIAFGALFFWLPFAVLLTAIVGGSQTSHLIPKVLEELRKDFEKSHPRSAELLGPTGAPIPLADFETTALPDISSPYFRTSGEKYQARWSCGGLQVWQADKFADFTGGADGSLHHRSFAWLGMALSVTIVAIPTGCAMAISWLTPTDGFGCRAVTQLSLFAMWMLSILIDWLLSVWARARARSFKVAKGGGSSSRYLTSYKITFAKDVVFLAFTIALLTLTALGVFNQCDCWCKWPRSAGYLSFPQDDHVFQLIKQRLLTTFLPIVCGAFASQAIILGLVCYYFQGGHRVLKQRDIDSILFPGKPFWRRWLRRRQQEQPVNSFEMH